MEHPTLKLSCFLPFSFQRHALEQGNHFKSIRGLYPKVATGTATRERAWKQTEEAGACQPALVTQNTGTRRVQGRGDWRWRRWGVMSHKGPDLTWDRLYSLFVDSILCFCFRAKKLFETPKSPLVALTCSFTDVQSGKCDLAGVSILSYGWTMLFLLKLIL